MADTTPTSLAAASSEALSVRALYETLETRFNGTTWSLDQLMIGFSNDVGHIGRLILANDGTWPIDGDLTAELKHKLAESLWWTFVLADKLGVEIGSAFTETMSEIRAGLLATIDESKSVRSYEHLLTGTDADSATAAALVAYPGATIQRVETDSAGVYEAHLVTAAGERLTVQMDATFTVTGTQSGGPGDGKAGGAHGPSDGARGTAPTDEPSATATS